MSFILSDNHNDDTIQVEDICERVEELRGERDSAAQDFLDYREAKGGEAEWEEGEAKWATDNPDDAKELELLESLLSDMCGYGGNHQWEGDWYPHTLINDDYFQTYAEEHAKDCDMVGREASWPSRHIDWEAAAEELKQDYSAVEVKNADGESTTYQYR